MGIEKTNEHFRLLFDVKGRYIVHKIKGEEANYKLCRVVKVALGANGIPYVVTHDGRTIRYPSPDIKVNDTIKFNLKDKKIVGHLPFETGCSVAITGGANKGRIGQLQHRERHLGSFDIVHVKDARGHAFATRLQNAFVIGNPKPAVSLPKAKGIKLTIVEERDRRN
eukprot:GFYU01000358.1.p1 GENE.GFYU01000358.1~~GFYU01000358.1.p1  ORF type:complete len:167 (-),score=54.17 GFYU01000358.1:61-561(-)